MHRVVKKAKINTDESGQSAEEARKNNVPYRPSDFVVSCPTVMSDSSECEDSSGDEEEDEVDEYLEMMHKKYLQSIDCDVIIDVGTFGYQIHAHLEVLATECGFFK